MVVSVITVVYNNIATIGSCLESVYGQEDICLEHIIVDGNSSDGTLEVIKQKINGRVTKLISEKDEGIYDAMNKGLLLSTGDIVGFLNSDDFYADKFSLLSIVNSFESNKSLKIVYGNIEYVNENNIDHTVRFWKSENFHKGYFESGNVPPHPSLFVKRECFDQIGSFDLDFKLAADYEFMFRLFKQYGWQSCYLDVSLVKMRLGGATNNSIRNILKQNIEILNAWRRNGISPPLLLMPKRLLKRLNQFWNR
jgi:glycosyltransferase